MKKKIVLRNASIAVIQVITSGTLLFFLYRYLLKTIGMELLGVWSIVLATTAAAKVSELGFSGSAVKFIAKYLALNNPKRVSEMVQTATLSVALFMGSLAIIAYAPLQYLLEYAVPPKRLDAALVIFPYALISLWLNSIAGVFQSGLDGCQRIDIKSYLIFSGNVLFFLAVFTLVPNFGFIGLAYAQIFQSVIMLVVGWILLRKELLYMPILPIYWNQSAFLEMWRYALTFQVNSMATMLYDPVTKALLGKFGGLNMVGIYEMASRMILQFRTIVISANQVLVPAIASLNESDKSRIPALYQQSLNLVLFLAIPYFATILSALPFISEIWIGHYDDRFITISILLAAGWFYNLLIGPAYFSYLGIGRLRWNTTSHLTIGVLNFFFGLLLGNFYGGYGVVAGWVISLIIGSSVVIVAYHFENQLSLNLLFPISMVGLIAASIVGCVSAAFLYVIGKQVIGIGWAEVLAIITLMGVIFPVMAKHPIASFLTLALQPKRGVGD